MNKKYDLYNGDEEIHARSSDYAYILKYLDEKIPLIQDFDNYCELQNKFIKKYAEYLYENDKENVLKMIRLCMINNYDEKYANTFIYKPAHMDKILNQKGTFVLKFKRVENDNLEEK